MQKLKILAIGGLSPWHPRAGGGERYSYKLSRAIVENGHNLDYIAIGPSNNPDIKEDFINFYPDGFFYQLSRYLKCKDYDIIHLHAVNGSQGHCLAYGINRLLKWNTKFVIQIHSPLVHKLPRSLGEVFTIIACKNSDLIFSVSDFSKKNISESYNIPASKIMVVHGGVDESILNIARKENNNEYFTLLFIGRLGGPQGLKSQKGVDILLEAMPLILKEHKVKLNLIGTGDIEPFINLAYELGIKKYVNFLGFVDDNELLQHYQNSDVFVFPSRRESFGLVLAEAMASGLPVVSTTAGAIPEVVENGESGILVPPEDPDELAGAIIHLLDDPEKMILMGKKGKEIVKQNFTWDKVAARVLDCYNEILGY